MFGYFIKYCNKRLGYKNYTLIYILYNYNCNSNFGCFLKNMLFFLGAF